MATNYDLRLVVDADTSEAQRKLDALGEGASAPGGGSGAPGAPSPTPAAHEAAERVRQARNGLGGGSSGGVGRQPQEFGRAAGDVAGKMIGKAVAGFMAHEVASVVFNGLKTPGGDNRTVNKAEATVGGAMKYATMGAMLGGPLGAIIGGIAGAGVGYFQEDQRQKKAVEARDNAMRRANEQLNVSTAMSASDSAFGKALELSGGWRQRQEMIRARRDEIESGSGSWSIASLEKKLKALDPESDDSKTVASQIEMQRNRVASLDQQLLDERLAVAPSRMDPASVADSWAKRGVQVGAQVDVAQVNEKIMGEVQGCRALLEKIANMANDGQIGVGRMIEAVYR